uniref:Photosystem II manganese-stabilizing polypeptide n=1 Tax=Desertifilum tharense IPPAS B-1220 TaxID=1781255 RepID=A0ACD5GQY1_9CYAN
MRYRAFLGAILALCLCFITACSDAASTSNKQLTYDDIRGTGLANNCPQLGETARGAIPIDNSQTYEISELCLQPTAFFVKEESVNKRQAAEFIPGKLLTRYTSTLTQIMGTVTSNADKSLTFKETDGIDFQAITVQLPGGEQFPFLFTIKGLTATTQPGVESLNTSTDFEGSFKVPSYRGATFLDPKGRGLATGYDNAVALPAQADNRELVRANVKQVENRNGEISLQIAKVDNRTGEIAGTFESIQPSDNDLGAKESVDIMIRGIFYARFNPQAA